MWMNSKPASDTAPAAAAARGGVDDLLVGRVTVRLTEVDVDELEAGVDTRAGGLHGGAVIEVDVHLDAELGPVVVDQAAHVRQTDGLHLALAEFDEDRRALRSSSARDRDEGLLVVDVERSDGEALPAPRTHHPPRRH